MSGAAKGLSDFAKNTAKQALSKQPVSKTVTGAPITDGLTFGSLGHGAQEATAAGMKALSRAPGNLGIDFSKAFPLPDAAPINATPGWSDFLKNTSAKAQDFAKNNPKTMSAAGQFGQQILSPPGGQAAPAVGAPNAQFNQGQQRGQTAEDQMNAFLMQLFQGRQ